MAGTTTSPTTSSWKVTRIWLVVRSALSLRNAKRWKGQTNEAPKCQKPERSGKFESRLMHLSDQFEKFASCRVGGGLSFFDTCGCPKYLVTILVPSCHNIVPESHFCHCLTIQLCVCVRLCQVNEVTRGGKMRKVW